MELPPPLFAAIEEVLKALVPIIALVIWIISQILGSKRAEPAKPKNPAPQGELPENPELRAEIEKFLREASGEKKPAAAPQPREAVGERPPRERAQREPKKDRRPRPTPQRAEPKSAPAEAEVVMAEAVAAPLAPGQAHLQTSTFNTSTLGRDVLQSRERIEKRIHKAFDHDLVTVDDHVAREMKGASVAAQSAAPAPAPTAYVADLFTDPADLRKAIILGEILRRPEDRWA